MQQWEYSVSMVVQSTVQEANEALNNLGKQGWELVSCVLLGKQGELLELQYYFKRPKRQSRQARVPRGPKSH
jgi:hypothetical protein